MQIARSTVVKPPGRHKVFHDVWESERTLTSAEDLLRCQVTSQLIQVWILPVVQLPARDPQVEAQPRRVRVHVARPVHLLVAVLLAGAPPAGKRYEETNSRHFKQPCKKEPFPGPDIPDLSRVWNLLERFPPASPE